MKLLATLNSSTFEKLKSSLFLLSIPAQNVNKYVYYIVYVYMWRPTVNDACLVDRSAKSAAE